MQIVLCYPVQPRHVSQLSRAIPGARVINAGQEQIARRLGEADVFIGHAKVPVDWASVVQTGRLKWIQSSAAGLDHCLTPEVIASPDIQVSSASGLFADQVAEQAMALLLGVVRSIPTFVAAQRERGFERLPTHDLHGARVAIVGLGGNGRRLAEVLRPWRVRIHAVDYFADQPSPPGVESVSPPEALHDVLRRSDVAILCVPLNARTRALIDARAFAAMPDDAILINVARGPVVDQAALVETLHAGRLRGVGLDVLETEPPADDAPIWRAPRALITPHVGAQSARRVDVTTDFACRNLQRRSQGLSLWNLVDKQLGFPAPEHRPPDDWRLLAGPQPTDGD